MLGVFMDDKRKERMAQVVAGRTYGIVPVVEGLIDLGNVAAVCRSAEALGCQNVHLIERGDKKYRSSQRITAGADKWLDFETWGTTEQCFAALRERGYRIAVTYCDGGSVSTPIEDMDWSIPTAVVLGNEHAGVSPEAIAGADLQCSIPMDGFVDSFNISVAAAIIMHYAKRQRGRRGDLTPEQQEILTAEFYLRNNSTTEDVLQHLLSKSSVVPQGLRSKL
ncbi:hypothetical protein KFL_000450360 [Klebsormidium nitens]|uniref:tRNA/rRNA methyltransferase SpoU type domain-containing protein n=1 Tax=Klebsormidium nitens TaxID=105231 RepID=A0A1Y1HSC0_KLENI|nr:hypothetical protein KFL_000450360 [Klebsormidium nitens]|eukprot:GAQ80079.1 hypothetical protein KFL_000450360 [Klebsormidium nitens]